MKHFNFLVYVVLIALSLKFNLFDKRPLRGFLNLPFEKQMRFFPEFQKFLKDYKGKLNIIQIFHGGEPYAVFTKHFYPNATDSEKVPLKDLKKDEILEIFTNRGFEVDEYEKKLKEKFKKMETEEK